MKPVITTGIVLTRTNFGEADRIITFLTPDQGKVRVLAKGVRRANSKLAGGIELFSESQISFIRGRGEIGTLVSTRLRRYYDQIVTDLTRTALAYECLKIIQKNTEDAVGEEYYTFLQKTLDGLNALNVACNLIEIWFNFQFIKIAGHTPNLSTDTTGRSLDQNQLYLFDIESMAFALHPIGIYNANHIKLIRLALTTNLVVKLAKVHATPIIFSQCLSLSQTMLKAHIRI